MLLQRIQTWDERKTQSHGGGAKPWLTSRLLLLSSSWLCASLGGHYWGWQILLNCVSVFGEARITWWHAVLLVHSRSDGFLPQAAAPCNLEPASLGEKPLWAFSAASFSAAPTSPLHSRIPSLFLLLSCSFVIRLHLSPKRKVSFLYVSVFQRNTNEQILVLMPDQLH